MLLGRYVTGAGEGPGAGEGAGKGADIDLVAANELPVEIPVSNAETNRKVMIRTFLFCILIPFLVWVLRKESWSIYQVLTLQGIHI